jgi:CxxC motif-containing protein
VFELTCILCPNGCSLIVNYDADGNMKVTGNKCKRGENFAFDEITCPKRSLTSTVKTSFKNIRRLPVKTDKDIPLKDIFSVMIEINKVVLDRKVTVNDIIIENVCNLGVNIVAASDTDYLVGDE